MLEFALAAVPLLALLGALLLGRYPGCDAIVRLGDRVARTRVGAGSEPGAARPRLLRSFAARGGLLLAFGLAKRPPPLAA